MPLYETSQFRVEIEGDRINIHCRDDRLIAEGVNEEYTKHTYKRITTCDVEKFLEEITAEFWKAGVREGRKNTIDEIKKIEGSIKSLLGEK